MGKMMDAQSITIATAATEQVGKESSSVSWPGTPWPYIPLSEESCCSMPTCSVPTCRMGSSSCTRKIGPEQFLR